MTDEKMQKYLLQVGIVAFVLVCLILLGNLYGQALKRKVVTNQGSKTLEYYPDMSLELDPQAVQQNFDETSRWLQYFYDTTQVIDIRLDSTKGHIHDTIYGNPDVMINHDTVFAAYQNITLAVDASDARWVQFDTETRNDGIYTAIESDSIIDVSTAGDYKVTYTVVVYSSAVATSGIVVVRPQKYSGSWDNISGALCTVRLASDATTQGYVMLTKSFEVTLAAGNDLAIQVENYDDDADSYTIADKATSIMIEKLF